MTGAAAAKGAPAAHTAFLERVLVALDLPDEGWHLDVAAGDGALVREVARLRPRVESLGLVPDAEALALARRLSSGVPNAHFHAAGPASPPDATFERISAVGALGGLPDKLAALVAWRAVAAPGGRLLVGEPFATRGPGTLGAGPLSHDALAMGARRAGWRLAHREDLTPLVAKLRGQGAWAPAVGEGQRYALSTLLAAPAAAPP